MYIFIMKKKDFLNYVQASKEYFIVLNMDIEHFFHIKKHLNHYCKAIMI